MMKNVLYLVAVILTALTVFLAYSCSSDEYDLNESSVSEINGVANSTRSLKSLNGRALLIDSIAESDEFLDFQMGTNLLIDKVLAYTSKLNKEEFDELMYNLNNDDYMTDFADKAGITDDLLLVAEAKNKLLSNTNLLKLDKTEQTQLFLNFSERPSSVMLKTRGEGNIDTGICDMRRQADYSWARAIADLGLVGCTCLVEIPLAACVCYTTVLANYANDLRLADRAYEDCIQSLKK